MLRDRRVLLLLHRQEQQRRKELQEGLVEVEVEVGRRRRRAKSEEIVLQILTHVSESLRIYRGSLRYLNLMWNGTVYAISLGISAAYGVRTW